MSGKIDVMKNRDENIKKLEENFILDTEYKTVLDNITTTCKVCGTQSTKTARTFIRGGCQTCKSIERKRLRKEKLREEDEQYLDKVNRENNNEYKIVKYRKNKRDSIVLEHIPCGNKREITNRNVKVVCSNCNPEKLIDADWYAEKYKQLVEDGYDVLDVEYGGNNKSKGRSTLIKLIHHECGTEFTRSNMTLKQPDGHLCPLCVAGKKKRHFTDEDIDFKVKNAIGEEYEYSHGYTNSKNPFYIRHIPCGEVYKTRLSTLYKGLGTCRKCNNKSKE